MAELELPECLRAALAARTGLILLVGSLDSGLAATFIAAGIAVQGRGDRKAFGVFGPYEPASEAFAKLNFEHAYDDPKTNRPVFRILEDADRSRFDVLIVEQIVDLETARRAAEYSREKLVIAGVWGSDVFSAFERFDYAGISPGDLSRTLILVLGQRLPERTSSFQALELTSESRSFLQERPMEVPRLREHAKELGVRDF